MNAWRWWPRHLLLGWLNLVLAAPVIYLYVGLPLILREQGWSGTQIGLLQLAGLPGILKFLLATPVERYALGRSSYRNWALLLSVLYAAVLLWLAAVDLQQTSHVRLFLLALAINVLSTWADIPVNALAICWLPASERIRAGAVRSAALSLAAILGGGVMLLAYSRLGWAMPLRVLALALLAAVVLLLLLQFSWVAQAPVLRTVEIGWRHWTGYFSGQNRRRWGYLLLTYFPFIGAAWVYLKPLLLDQGFHAEQIAVQVGIAGGVVAALASLAASRFTRWIGADVALPLFAVGNLLALGSLLLALALDLGTAALSASALLIALSMGASGGLLFGLMLHQTRPGLAALDYGIQSSVFIMVRTLVPLLAGLLLDRFGPVGMLSGLWLGLGLALLLALQARQQMPRATAACP